jgi:hypothetical protein
LTKNKESVFFFDKPKKGGVDLGEAIINPFSFDLILERGDAWREKIKGVL